MLQTYAFLIKQGFQIKKKIKRLVFPLKSRGRQRARKQWGSSLTPTDSSITTFSRPIKLYQRIVTNDSTIVCAVIPEINIKFRPNDYILVLVFNCLVSTLCLPILSYTTGLPSTSTFFVISVNCDSWKRPQVQLGLTG